MVIIVHSAESKKSIQSNIGAKDYSYYFVLEKYRKVLGQFATVIEIRNPEVEADIIYNRCLSLGIPCLFFSFTPPFKTATELKCPTVSVFAWEYTTIPSEVWGGDSRNDWRNVFRKHGRTITHSSFAVRTVKKEMGEGFPVWSIPAPVWDNYTKFYMKGGNPGKHEGFDLNFEGALIDFQGCDIPSVTEKTGTEKPAKDPRPVKSGKKSIHLKGIIYTTVFNPADGRKNWGDLLTGFIWAFRDVNDVTLVMKLSHYDLNAFYVDMKDSIEKLGPFNCRVVAIHGYLDHESYSRLVQNTTYVVNTARGEGQCLPLMEYMSAGKPAVSPCHTAMEDYINEGDAFIVRSSTEWSGWPHDPRMVYRTFCYRIDWESLYNAYRDSYSVAKDEPQRYSRMAECAVTSLERYCSKGVAVDRLKDVFRQMGVQGEELVCSPEIEQWYRTYRRIYLLKTWRVSLLRPKIVYIKNTFKTRFPRLFKLLMKGYGYVGRKKSI